MPGQTPTANADSYHDQVAALAYQLWLDRGSPTGSAEIDWFRAEEALKNRIPSSGTTRSHHHARIPYGIREAGVNQSL